jgi:hypothetical protein
MSLTSETRRSFFPLYTHIHHNLHRSETSPTLPPVLTFVSKMSPKQLSTVTPTEFDRTTPLKEFMTTCSLEERSRIFTEIYRNTLLLEGNDPDWALGGAGRNNWVMAGASSRGYLSGEEFAEEHLRVWTVWKLARDIRDYPPQGGIQALSMASDEQRATSTVSDTPVVSVFRSWASNLGAPKTFRDMSRRFQRDRSPHASARSDQASSAQSTVSSISDLDLIPLPLPLSIQESLGPRGLELVIRSLQILNANPPTLGTEGDQSITVRENSLREGESYNQLQQSIIKSKVRHV